MEQRFRFQQFSLEDVIHVHQLVLIGEFTVKELVHFLDDFFEPGFFFFLHTAAARRGDRVQRGCVTLVERQGFNAQVFQVMVRKNYEFEWAVCSVTGRPEIVGQNACHGRRLLEIIKIDELIARNGPKRF